MEPIKIFWMVHGNGPCHVRHATQEIAVAEAKRLARLNPGERFYVTEATSVHFKNDVQSVSIRKWDADRDLPF
ncbi:MAG: hypothetical protein JSS66_18825 [Armatimonadetes bacterium]|nr:hypothetical protein [Armatimonadota bacterium]